MGKQMTNVEDEFNYFAKLKRKSPQVKKCQQNVFWGSELDWINLERFIGRDREEKTLKSWEWDFSSKWKKWRDKKSRLCSSTTSLAHRTTQLLNCFAWEGEMGESWISNVQPTMGHKSVQFSGKKTMKQELPKTILHASFPTFIISFRTNKFVPITDHCEEAPKRNNWITTLCEGESHFHACFSTPNRSSSRGCFIRYFWGYFYG